MGVPVRGFEENGEQAAAAEKGMQRQSFEEAMERMGTTLGEVGAEAVAADVFHLMLVWKGRDGATGVFSMQRFVKKDEIRKAAAYAEGGSLKGFEISLQQFC